MTRFAGVLLGIAGTLLLLPAQAYEGTPEQQVAQFFADAHKGKKHAAIDRLFGSNPAMPNPQLILLKQQWSTLESLYGEHRGHEPLRHSKLSPALHHILSLEKYAQHPVIWEFWFYKSDSGWVLSQGLFNDRFDVRLP